MRKQLVEKRISMVLFHGNKEKTFWVKEKTYKFLLCADKLRDYFDFPHGVKRLTAVLSNRYSAGTCYQLVRVANERWSNVVVDGKSIDEVLFDRADDLVLDFFRKHGTCYASIEYEE